MNASLLTRRDYQVVALRPSFENVHALLTEIHLYVFGQDGRLIESQAVRREKVMVAVSDEELRGAKIVIAPPLERVSSETLNLEWARGQYVFEMELPHEPGKTYYELSPVPEAVWRWWLVHSLWKNVGKLSTNKASLLAV
jgi:hypothetical protein